MLKNHIFIKNFFKLNFNNNGDQRKIGIFDPEFRDSHSERPKNHNQHRMKKKRFYGIHPEIRRLELFPALKKST